MENNYLELLDAAIAKHSLGAVWVDGLFERTEEAPDTDSSAPCEAPLKK